MALPLVPPPPRVHLATEETVSKRIPNQICLGQDRSKPQRWNSSKSSPVFSERDKAQANPKMKT